MDGVGMGVVDGVGMGVAKSTYPPPPPQSVQCLIQLCIGSWPSVVGSSDVMRTLHTSARPVSRQGTVVFDLRVPATPRVPLRCVRYYGAKIRLHSTKTLCRAGSGVAHSGRLCTLGVTGGVSMAVMGSVLLRGVHG